MGKSEACPGKRGRRTPRERHNMNPAWCFRATMSMMTGGDEVTSRPLSVCTKPPAQDTTPKSVLLPQCSQGRPLSQRRRGGEPANGPRAGTAWKFCRSVRVEGPPGPGPIRPTGHGRVRLGIMALPLPSCHSPPPRGRVGGESSSTISGPSRGWIGQSLCGDVWLDLDYILGGGHAKVLATPGYYVRGRG